MLFLSLLKIAIKFFVDKTATVTVARCDIRNINLSNTEGQKIHANDQNLTRLGQPFLAGFT